MGADGAPAQSGDAISIVPEVDLLERSLGWTCAHLARVRPDDLTRATPCSTWNLADLLAHMEDGLDAFSEGAAGFVTPVASPRIAQHPVPRIPVLQAKATALLASWIRPAVPLVRTGSALLPARVLVATAALEIAVHGWDVAVATASTRDPLPRLTGALAYALLPIAEATVAAADRPQRFGPPRSARSEDPGDRLLAFLGR